MRLHFKEKAYEQALIKDGYKVAGLYCVSRKKYIFNFLKLHADEDTFVYISFATREVFDGGYKEILEQVENHFTNGKLDRVFTIGFIDSQVQNKINFDSIGLASIDYEKYEKYCDKLFDDLKNYDVFNFCRHLEKQDLSHLYNWRAE